MPDTDTTEWPRIRPAGFDGFLVSFADRLDEPANRAAIALRDAIDKAGWPALRETATSLVSTYLRFDPFAQAHAEVRDLLETLLTRQDWFATPLPPGRRLWRIPAAFGGDLGPQLADAAAAAGLSPADAIASIAATRVRVQTIGFAPGMPYLGELPAAWNIPRQTALSPRVPAGALCVAIRQLVLFPVTTPTGWRHIGQTRFDLFRPASNDPFALRTGDEVIFAPVTAAALDSASASGNGGATSEIIP